MADFQCTAMQHSSPAPSLLTFLRVFFFFFFKSNVSKNPVCFFFLYSVLVSNFNVQINNFIQMSAASDRIRRQKRFGLCCSYMYDGLEEVTNLSSGCPLSGLKPNDLITWQ